jgi:hypothetical protein
VAAAPLTPLLASRLTCWQDPEYRRLLRGTDSQLHELQAAVEEVVSLLAKPTLTLDGMRPRRETERRADAVK